VADLGWLRLSGIPARLLWLLVHLFSMVQFQNRLLVLVQWVWSYFTRNRSALLIPENSPVQSAQDAEVVSR
jgi:NADH dehydrogenase